MARIVKFSLNLSYDKFLYVYKGQAKNVVTKTMDGRTIQFPAEILKPYLTRNGVSIEAYAGRSPNNGIER